MELKPGQKPGLYEIVSLLGKGGMVGTLSAAGREVTNRDFGAAVYTNLALKPIRKPRNDD